MSLLLSLMTLAATTLDDTTLIPLSAFSAGCLIMLSLGMWVSSRVTRFEVLLSENVRRLDQLEARLDKLEETRR
jgi:hypothetical protein